MDQVVQLLAEGKVEYPAHWEDSKKNELARAFAEYVNEEVVADYAYVSLSHMGFDDLKAGWDPVDKKWHSSHHSSETTDFTGESLPELVVPGYSNSEGQEVIVDPQTGQETIVPKITLPELGEVTLSQLYLMGQSDLKNYVTSLMLKTPSLPNNYDGYIQQTRNNRFALPFVMEKNVNNNERFYNEIRSTGQLGKEIPDSNAFLGGVPTSSVLMPILDSETNEVILWLRIQQGTQIKTHSFNVAAEGDISWQYANDRGTPIGFAGEPALTPAIVVVGNTTAITYEQFGTSRNWLLEHGKEGGIGSEAELRQLLQNKSVQELMQFLPQIRLLAVRPDIIVYQGQ
ncbi:MAG: hypothetical protein KJZ53_00390 [Anaerolineales bacterium]|nr:hypothetical protein [Anaerolineales bacterium]